MNQILKIHHNINHILINITNYRKWNILFKEFAYYMKELSNKTIIAILGGTAGKTCILNRLLHNEFWFDSEPTIGASASR